jgi:hypothetical protein
MGWQPTQPRLSDDLDEPENRQTILNQVRAGRRNAVHVLEGKRRGMRIEIRPGEQGLLEPASSPHA